MFKFFIIVLGKIVTQVIRLLNLGHGSTWPGHIALNADKNFIKNIIRLNPHLKIILIAGTNGKTTTGKLIQTILENAGNRVFQNEAGANLLNGIASSMLLHSSILSTINYDYAIFEVDEATLPLVLNEVTPDYIILLNLFRDQLDRYGEVNTIAHKWKSALENLSNNTVLILNADDPQIAYLDMGHFGKRSQVPDGTWRSASRIPSGDKRFWTRRAPDGDPSSQNDEESKVFYFGLKNNTLGQTGHQHAVDSTYCPSCQTKLYYHSIYYSHLGDWECKNCGYKRPKNIFSTPPPSRLAGTYNHYNILAATLVTKKIGISESKIKDSLKTFTPAFGRQEAIEIYGKKVKIFLSKNPTSFNESLRAISSLNANNVLFVLNDRIPDGRDVSWIWDVDFEDYIDKFEQIVISGDRCYDMGLRIKYASKFSIFPAERDLYDNFQFSMKNSNFNFQIEEDLKKAMVLSLHNLQKSETLYILPTYSAMLEVRKILTGKKIL